MILGSFTAAHDERDSDSNSAGGDGYADPPGGCHTQITIVALVLPVLVPAEFC